MPPRAIATPVATALFRIGRRPDPLAWAPWAYVGDGRFDDPERRRYRVLYAGERRACFLETLADFRPGLDGALTREFARDWIESRLIAEFTLVDPTRDRRWLDLRAPETHQVLRREFGPLLLDQGFSDFDISTATSDRLDVSQRIGGWCFERGYAGIVYLSRLDPARTCWAIFERTGRDASLLHVITIRPIAETDPDLRAVVALFGLPWPPSS